MILDAWPSMVTQRLVQLSHTRLAERFHAFYWLKLVKGRPSGMPLVAYAL